MRLLDRILRDGAWYFPFEKGGELVPFDTAQLAGPPIRVIGDQVAAIYWHSPKLAWNFSDDFGPLRLPFPHMWVEGRQPSSGFAIEGPYTNGPCPITGALLTCWAGDSAGIGSVVDLILHGRDPGLHTPTGDEPLVVGCLPFEEINGRVYVLPPVFLEIDAAGVYVGREVNVIISEGANAKLLARSAIDAAKVPMLIVSFMNCRNVSIAPASSPHTTRSARRRSGGSRPPLRFSEVRLPGGRHDSLAGAKAAAGAGISAHLVRGHFKTYTDDHPLLGRHTGTWWWNWQARGSGPGVVIPRYKVAP